MADGPQSLEALRHFGVADVNPRARLWDAARALAEAGAMGALATVCRHRGSLPMARDAKMLVTPEGRRWGTVGGGCTEADVTAQALAAARAGRPSVVRHTLNADVAGDIGLSCGGTVELFVEPLVASSEAAVLYGSVARAIVRRQAVTVMTAVNWESGPSKAALVAGETTVVGSWTPPLTAHGSRGAGAATATPFVDDEAGALIEPVARTPRVLVFGAGHVGAEVARLAARAGFHVVLVDDREEFANARRVPEAHEILVEDFRSVLDRVALDEDDCVLATTRGHSYDAYIVERAAPSRAGYVGMLGSKRKRAVIWKALEQAGVPRHALERVRVPIGEPIGADTPVEIAVAVVAELIRWRRSGPRREPDRGRGKREK